MVTEAERFLLVMAERDYSRKVLATGPIAYFPLWEASGTVAHCLVNSAHNGTYARDVATMTTDAGIGDGNTAAYFDGTNDYVDIYSTTFRDAFNGTEGTLMAWFKVSAAGIWTDGNNHFAVNLQVDAENYVRVYKTTANNRLLYVYEAGNTLLSQQKNGVSTTDYMCLALSWSASADTATYYYNGAVEGTPDNTLGTWVGNLANTTTIIGAQNSTPLNPASAYVSHVAVWDYVLSGSVIAQLYQV